MNLAEYLKIPMNDPNGKWTVNVKTRWHTYLTRLCEEQNYSRDDTLAYISRNVFPELLCVTCDQVACRSPGCVCEHCNHKRVRCITCDICKRCRKEGCDCEAKAVEQKRKKAEPSTATQPVSVNEVASLKKKNESLMKKNAKQKERIAKYIDDLNEHSEELGAHKVEIDALKVELGAHKLELGAFERYRIEMDEKLLALAKEASEQNERLRLEITVLVDASNEKKRKRDDGGIALDGPTRECLECGEHKSINSFQCRGKDKAGVRKICYVCTGRKYRIKKKTKQADNK